MKDEPVPSRRVSCKTRTRADEPVEALLRIGHQTNAVSSQTVFALSTVALSGK